MCSVAVVDYMFCYVQSMNMYNSCIVLYKVLINTLHNKLDLFHSMVCPLGTLCKVWIKQTGLCFLGSHLMLRSHACIAV